MVFILAAPMVYKLIQQNMPQALPSIRTVQSTIHSEYKKISEGSSRFDELREHLNQYNASLFVSIAEDATVGWNMIAKPIGVSVLCCL